jgi:hypothetical protein
MISDYPSITQISSLAAQKQEIRSSVQVKFCMKILSEHFYRENDLRFHAGSLSGKELQRRTNT